MFRDLVNLLMVQRQDFVINTDIIKGEVRAVIHAEGRQGIELLYW
jgi:hypothetical protein